MGKKEDAIIQAKVDAINATKAKMEACAMSAADATAAMAKFTSEKAGTDVMLAKAQDPKFTGKAPPAACPTQ